MGVRVMAKKTAAKTSRRTRKTELVEGLGERKELKPSTGFLSSGCAILDLAIADQLPGGFPAGRISHVYGLESSAKTVIMTEPLGAAQRAGGTAFYEDAEQTCDFDRLPLFGLDPGAKPLTPKKNWAYNVPTTVEDLFDVRLLDVAEQCDPKKPNAMGIDSLSALPSEAERETKMTDGTFGTSRAKQASLAFRKHLTLAANANLAMIFVDQSRDNIGVTYGPKEVVSGGKALKFYSSVRIHTKVLGKLRNKKDGPVVGMMFGFEVVKNKIAPPLRNVIVYLLFDYGIDDIRTSLEWLKDNSEGSDKSTLRCSACGHEVVVNRDVKSAGRYCPKCSERFTKVRRGGGYQVCGQSFRSVHDAIAWVEENKKEDALRTEVFARWREVYATPDRAPKRRV